MKKAIYIHGLGSNSNSSTGKYLKEHLIGYEVLTPDVPFEPSKARAFVMELLNKERPELVVASSLGAFYVMIYGTNFPCTKLLINPAMTPYNDIKNSIGLGTDYGNGNIIDEEFLRQLKYYEDLFYGCAYEAYEYTPNTFALFGTNDELFSHIKDYKIWFRDDYMKVIPTGHKLKESELHYLMKYINEVTQDE